MAQGIYFAHEGFTPEKYDEAMSHLEGAGAGSPKGRSSHFAGVGWRDTGLRRLGVAGGLRRVRRDPGAHTLRSRRHLGTPHGVHRVQLHLGLGIPREIPPYESLQAVIS